MTAAHVSTANDQLAGSVRRIVARLPEGVRADGSGPADGADTADRSDTAGRADGAHRADGAGRTGPTHPSRSEAHGSDPAGGQPRPAWGWRLLRSPLTIAAVDLGAIIGATALRSQIDPASAVYAGALLLWLAAVGSYRRRIAPSIQLDIRSLIGALACPLLVLAVIDSPTTLRLLRTAPLLTLFVVVGRVLSYDIVRAAKARTVALEPTLVVGAGELGCKIVAVLHAHPEYGLRPVGFVDSFPDDVSLPLAILGDIDTLDEAVRRTGAVRVIVAFGANREPDIAAVLRTSEQQHLKVHVIPRLFELGVTPAGPDTDMVGGFPLQQARRAALRSGAWRTKRVIDVVMASVLLVLAAPVLAAAALSVRLTSRGPIFFRQRRVGQRGEVVEIIKFRSMHVNPGADTEWGGQTDKRVTAVGRVLRATNVDELPQLLNVVKGDMSLVGPRPERPHFARQFNQNVYRYQDRVRVPAGVTGWAQVHGLRGDTSIEERARFDNYYIEHWSPWLDAVILGRTVTHVAQGVTAEVWSRLRPRRRGGASRSPGWHRPPSVATERARRLSDDEAGLPDDAASKERFGDLHGVERGTLAQVVPGHEQD